MLKTIGIIIIVIILVMFITGIVVANDVISLTNTIKNRITEKIKEYDTKAEVKNTNIDKNGLLQRSEVVINDKDYTVVGFAK